MTTPITVTFPKSKASPWLEAEIHERVERLKVLFKDILSCRVVVDIPHRRHQRGNRFSIRIELAVPGEDLAITRDANVHGVAKDLDEEAWAKRFDVEATQRDVKVVLVDAFDAAKRQLRDYAQLRRREVKRHGPPPRVAAATAAGGSATRRVRAAVGR
ncbi:MAG: hypothetical protein JSU08_02315 [Acidobacteria bacterium]|nr:hypothetical protein [Acidobacteriota bacterium]